MKIYFSGSIRGGRHDASIYKELVDHLQKYGEVLTAFIGSLDLPELDEAGVTDQEIWQRDVRWVGEADVLVAEVTQTSLGVGYEIGLARKVGTPVLALYRETPGKRLSAMVAGDPNVKVIRYTKLPEAVAAIDEFLPKYRP
ncbi:MAG: nucleoside 2-deoxyribosyltransferase [FCB group bacterium]|nr:nucleoside 2-deoxyribosyltransferase [FCB group bacterium]